MIVAGVDVGGTGVKIGLVDEGHKVMARSKEATPQKGPDALIAAIAKQIAGFDKKPAAVGVGIPGAVSRGEIIQVPNLPNWPADFEFRKTLEKKLGVPVALGNDVNVGLLGEWLAGAAKGAANVLGVWMGTGIGGGLILDGRPYDGMRGAAGEIGHMVVRADGALCGCGRRGCVEAYAGRRMMSETAHARQAAGRKTSLFEIQDEEDKERLTSKVWAEALEKGDAVATEIFDEAIAALGLGIGSVLNLLDLERVVIGGGFAERMGKKLAERIEAAARPRVMAPNPKLKYVAASLGDDSGIVGAAALARALVIKS
ncbi:MAG: ROK family protein [Gammaproteobacteria bacterium]